MHMIHELCFKSLVNFAKEKRQSLKCPLCRAGTQESLVSTIPAISVKELLEYKKKHEEKREEAATVNNGLMDEFIGSNDADPVDKAKLEQNELAVTDPVNCTNPGLNQLIVAISVDNTKSGTNNDAIADPV